MFVGSYTITAWFGHNKEVKVVRICFLGPELLDPLSVLARVYIIEGLILETVAEYMAFWRD